jgi:UDP-glucose 4-epimerase
MSMTKKVLVIGGNGYVGSRLVHDLQSKYIIHSVDLCWFSKKTPNNETKDYKNLTKKELATYDIIILLAGHSSVKMCEGPIFSSWNNNVNNFVELLTKLDKSQVLIYASSGSVYGLSTSAAVESDNRNFKPINHYDLTKYSLDVQAEKYIKEGYKIIGLRFGTVNGWSPNVREELMINSMVKKSIFEKELIINNKQIKRPILGIADISRAIKNIIDNPAEGIYNLSSFTDTVENISNTISTIFNSELIETSNFKGVYDFDMNTEKFSKTYNFTFTSSIQTIVEELSSNIDRCSFTNRNKFIDYE